jgi:hypothetical protein
MTRAGVFIGVDRAGDLPQLGDAAAGARRMYEWALYQGLPDRTHARLITDDGGRKVEPTEISDAVESICNGAGVDQLVLYFAGHGVNLQRGDRWLLSDAPARSYAAVNVKGSVELARMCGIPHVVVISDACRVAPQGIQNQNVEGIEIFPNSSGGDRSNPVDQFFACYLGRTAAEIKDPNVETASYSALYTDALLDALLGSRQDVLEPADPGDAAMYVKPWRLHDYLVSEIPRRVKALKLETKVNQNPDSIITSRNSWVARITTPAGTTRGKRSAAARLPPAPPPSLRTLTRELTATAAEQQPAEVELRLDGGVAADIPGAAQFAGALRRVSARFGPEHFETQCGIKVRGARIVQFTAPLASGTLLGGTGDVLRIERLAGAGASVLLRFDNGTGCVVPVVEGFLTAVTIDDGDLVDVAYEPSDNSPRWSLFRDGAQDIRTLRAIAATASREGQFHLDVKDAEAVGRRMRYGKSVDPTLAIYAAYAYHDLQLTDRIQEMSSVLSADVGVTFFDLELLGRRLVGARLDRQQRVIPFVPLLSQGWSLLRAHRVQLHPALSDIGQHLRASLWTQFDSRGIEKLAGALSSGDLR